MIPILAYPMQEKAYGGLKPSTRKRLTKLAKELELDPKAQLRSNVSLLVRGAECGSRKPERSSVLCAPEKELDLLIRRAMSTDPNAKGADQRIKLLYREWGCDSA